MVHKMSVNRFGVTRYNIINQELVQTIGRRGIYIGGKTGRKRGVWRENRIRGGKR
jgi:hypothetical protein